MGAGRWERAGPLAAAAGAACRALVPVRGRTREGSPSSPVAVCTLSSTGLLRALSGPRMLAKAAAVGRLMSENRGIDEMVSYLARRPGIRALVVCGADARGHAPGAALLALHARGADAAGRIDSPASPDPVLRAPRADVEAFRRRVRIVDMVGETDPARVEAAVDSLLQ